MAIKVNGTTVIDDSRNLVNIASGVGASTTSNAVGTYALLTGPPYQVYGSTASGSVVKPADASGGNSTGAAWTGAGTWRCMGHMSGTYGQYATTVFVRIS